FAPVLGHGIVARQGYHPVGNPMLQNETDQDAGQGPVGPTALRENAVVAGWVAGRQGVHGAQQIEDGLSSHRQDGGEHQDGKALECRPSESRRKLVQQRLRRVGKVRPEPPLHLPPRSALPLGLAAGSFGYPWPAGSCYSSHASLLAQNRRVFLCPSIPAKWLVFV